MPPTEAQVRGLSLSLIRGLALLASAALGLALVLWMLRAPDAAEPAPASQPSPQADREATATASGPKTPTLSSAQEGAGAPAPLQRPAASALDSQDLAAHVPPGQAPAMAEVIQRLNQAGVHTGLGAFNPPGTRPPMIGLAVPEDFDLPAGFVRHHQATDDGQRIEAVLMFAPDHPYMLAHPDLRSRVVPPEMAPEGLPLRTITLPAPRSRQP